MGNGHLPRAADLLDALSSEEVAVLYKVPKFEIINQETLVSPTGVNNLYSPLVSITNEP